MKPYRILNGMVFLSKYSLDYLKLQPGKGIPKGSQWLEWGSLSLFNGLRRIV